MKRLASTLHCALGLLAALLLGACREAPRPKLDGDRDNGRLLLRQYACGTCHRIPGVAAAMGNVGPSLEGIGQRVYLGGALPNSPANMARFIRDPKHVDPRTAMPDLQVGETHARDMVAYLEGLR